MAWGHAEGSRRVARRFRQRVGACLVPCALFVVRGAGASDGALPLSGLESQERLFMEPALVDPWPLAPTSTWRGHDGEVEEGPEMLQSVLVLVPLLHDPWPDESAFGEDPELTEDALLTEDAFAELGLVDPWSDDGR